MKTVLITGSSSGIGRATAQYFQLKGWNVAATMRKPENEKELAALNGVHCIRLDVSNVRSIQDAIKETITLFGGIDVVVNNAGYGSKGPFEAATQEQIEKQFAVNVFGTMNVIREILPHFRAKRSGSIINITSMGGLLTIPLNSVYHATKWAEEGFSESLAYELGSMNIKVKTVLPGAVKTNFDPATLFFENEGVRDYDTYKKLILARVMRHKTGGSDPKLVAKVIYQAATDTSTRLRYIAGNDARTLLRIRKLLPYRMFQFLIKKNFEKAL